MEAIWAMNLPDELRRNPALRTLREGCRAFAQQFGIGTQTLHGLSSFRGFIREFLLYKKLNAGSPFSMRRRDILPHLTDRTAITPLEPTYFLQDTWFARRVATMRPPEHVDVGSSAKSMAIIAQFIPVTMVDIRPVPLTVEGFKYLRGSVLALPFPDGSLASASSLCVIEHIGLGRYGDPFDARGSEKAAAELTRVLAQGGNLYISVPVDQECRIYFNAHRAFTRDYILSLFASLDLVEEKYIYGHTVMAEWSAAAGFGTGLYHFRKA